MNVECSWQEKRKLLKIKLKCGEIGRSVGILKGSVSCIVKRKNVFTLSNLCPSDSCSEKAGRASLDYVKFDENQFVEQGIGIKGRLRTNLVPN